MKRKLFFSAITLMAFSFIQAQTTPAGYEAGKVTLADGSIIGGFIKEDLKKNSSITFILNATAPKQEYNASQINAAEINGTQYLCIKGDFFKVLITGKLSFLQKASNAAGKAIYNGTEPIFSAGTEGKIGDYFSFANNSLKVITKKNISTFITSELAGCNAAIEKAKTVNGDVAALADAVTVYNNSFK